MVMALALLVDCERPECLNLNLPYNNPFVFTHGDLSLCNIMVARRQPNVPLRIAAIIDWEQSGWMPLSWDSYKARAAEESEEKRRYLAIITGDIDDDVYLAFDTFVMSLGGFSLYRIITNAITSRIRLLRKSKA